MKSILSIQFIWIAAVFLANAPLCAGIKWDSAQPVLIQAGGHYGRITRIDKDTLIAGFDFKRAIHIRLSHDQGRTWEAPVKVAEGAAGNLTNTELCVLKNGDVLCFFNLRPHQGGKIPYSIGMCRSSDRAKTWSAPATLHSAGLEFGDGCWEPAAIQLPTGEVQVYFANEPSFPFPDGSGSAQLWNALFIKNDRTITAVTETTRNGLHGIWAVDGVLEP